MVKVSVIIPVYNSAKTITRTLDSIKDQLLNDWEILIVDNGSTDKTVELVRNYVQDDKRIKLLFSDRGRSVARNYGIEKASGQYLLFLDADDEISSEMLLKATDYLDSHAKYTAIATSCIIQNDSNGKQQKKKVYYPFNNCLYGLNPFRINSVVLRNDDVSGFDTDLRICEDWLFWVENLAGREVKLLSNVYGSIVHVTGENSSNSYPEMLYYQLTVRMLIREKYSFSSLKLFVKDLKMLILGHYFQVIPDDINKISYLNNCSRLAKLLLKIPVLKTKFSDYAQRKQEEYIY